MSMRLRHEPTLKATKIDPPMATFNAIALMVTKPHSLQPSVIWIWMPHALCEIQRTVRRNE
jgi:phage terminase large subunit-like protein